MKGKLDRRGIKEFVEANKYPVGKDWRLARCVDGRQPKEDGLEPLVRPGADIGLLLMICAANRKFDLAITTDNLIKALVKAIGGYQNFRLHTDFHATDRDINAVSSVSDDVLMGCGHFKQAVVDPVAYALDEEDTRFVTSFVKKALSAGAVCRILEGEHRESAVLVVHGDDWTVASQWSKDESHILQAFVYQQTLDEKMRHELVRAMLPYVSRTFDNEKELYGYFSHIADMQLQETLKRLAKGLPIFEAKFFQGGDFTLKKLGTVS